MRNFRKLEVKQDSYSIWRLVFLFSESKSACKLWIRWVECNSEIVYKTQCKNYSDVYRKLSDKGEAYSFTRILKQRLCDCKWINESRIWIVIIKSTKFLFCDSRLRAILNCHMQFNGWNWITYCSSMDEGYSSTIYDSICLESMVFVLLKQSELCYF